MTSLTKRTYSSCIPNHGWLGKQLITHQRELLFKTQTILTCPAQDSTFLFMLSPGGIPAGCLLLPPGCPFGCASTTVCKARLCLGQENRARLRSILLTLPCFVHCMNSGDATREQTLWANTQLHQQQDDHLPKQSLYLPTWQWLAHGGIARYPLSTPTVI